VVKATYTASETARALGISLDTLRRWDRQGRIQVERDAANRRVVPGREIERLRGTEKHALSARNRFRGVVHEVKVEGLLAQVAAEELGLRPGMSASAVVKSTSVMVER